MCDLQTENLKIEISNALKKKKEKKKKSFNDFS